MDLLIDAAYLIAFLGVLFFIVWKRKKSKNKSELNYGVEDPVALAAAENEVKTLNIREEFSKKYKFLCSFSTMQGYSEEYMANIIKMLNSNNISSDFLFVESGPSGIISYTQRDGTFELYVETEKLEAALNLIDKSQNI